MKGFTLIELIAVIILLGVLGTVATPRFLEARNDAVMASLKQILQQMESGIRQYHLDSRIQGNTMFPDVLGDALESGIPEHPQNMMFGVPDVQNVNLAGIENPTNKVLKSGVAGVYWYNSANGIVRVRVGDIGSQSETLNFYNLVNNTNETSLGNYGSGGGGGS